MGEFSATCAVSNLPIEGGDDVRIFLLTRGPFGDRPCTMTDVWAPRTYPLRAQYNMYGGVDDVEGGPQHDVWLEGLKLDAVPKGWGRNGCHDVPVGKTMSWKQMMKAVWEERLYVRDDVPGLFSLSSPFTEMQAQIRLVLEKHGDKVPEAPQRRKSTVAVGVPTRARVEARLKAAKLPLYGDKDPDGPGTTNTGSSPGFTVSKVRFGEVMVRAELLHGGEWGKEAERLAGVQQVLAADYATVLRESLTEHNEVELLVYPKPGTKFNPPRRTKKKALQVGLAMIREDVWQAILSVAVPGEQGPKAAMKHFLKRPYKGNDLCGLVTPGTHLQLLKQKGPLPSAVAQAAAEFSYVAMVLSATRYYWRPGYTVGPQYGEWKAHTRLLEALAKVSKTSAPKGF